MVQESDVEEEGLAAITKAIIDLDKLVTSLLQGIAPTHPWQRRLLTRLKQADRNLQVLRMTIAMDRGTEELIQAADTLHITLRAAVGELAGGRSDLITRAAVRLAEGQASQLRKALAFEQNINCEGGATPSLFDGVAYAVFAS